MQLGQLSLYEKRGIFFKGNLREIPPPGREVEMVSDPWLLTGFNEGDELGLTDADRQHAIIPVEVEGNTTYITGTYKDAGNVYRPYTVTIWLLIEETPAALHE